MGQMYKSDETPRMAYHLALLGATDRQLAEAFDVSIDTIELWKRSRDEFATALKLGKLTADAEVATAFFRCATGYNYTEDQVNVHRGVVTVTKVERYKGPDAWAAAKWLAIRQRATWSEVQRTESIHTNINVDVDYSVLSFDELAVAKKLGLPNITRQLAANDAADN